MAPGKARLRIFFGAAIAVAVLAAFRFLPLQEAIRASLSWVERLGPAGVVFYVLVYVAGCVLFIPGSLLTLGAGAIYGVVRGSMIVSVAATLGAAAAFLIARYVARGWVAEKVEGDPRFKAVDEAVGREGWKIVGLTRLSPVFPFNLLNYAFGLTKVSFRDYVLASWLGMLPGTVLYVYVGSLAGNLAAVGSGRQDRTPAQWALYAAGLVATVATAAYVTRVARAALAKALRE